MSTWRRRVVVLALVLGLAHPAGLAGAEESAGDEACAEGRVSEAVVRIQARYDALTDLSARFEQTSESVVLSGASLGEPEASRGDVVFAKPGRMRWTYTEPEPSLVVSDGRIMWIYDPAEQQVTRLPVQQKYLAGAAIQFLLGDGKISESFDVTALGCTKDRIKLQLLPRQPESYEKLGLIADAETGLIVETAMIDLFGNRTRIRFEDVKLDQGPADGVFGFVVPEGVEVIDLEQP